VGIGKGKDERGVGHLPGRVDRREGRKAVFLCQERDRGGGKEAGNPAIPHHHPSTSTWFKRKGKDSMRKRGGKGVTNARSMRLCLLFLKVFI